MASMVSWSGIVSVDIGTEAQKLLMGRIGHFPKIGGIHLGVPAEKAEILVDYCRIEV